MSHTATSPGHFDTAVTLKRQLAGNARSSRSPRPAYKFRSAKDERTGLQEFRIEPNSDSESSRSSRSRSSSQDGGWRQKAALNILRELGTGRRSGTWAGNPILQSTSDRFTARVTLAGGCKRTQVPQTDALQSFVMPQRLSRQQMPTGCVRM